MIWTLFNENEIHSFPPLTNRWWYIWDTTKKWEQKKLICRQWSKDPLIRKTSKFIITPIYWHLPAIAAYNASFFLELHNKQFRHHNSSCTRGHGQGWKVSNSYISTLKQMSLLGLTTVTYIDTAIPRLLQCLTDRFTVGMQDRTATYTLCNSKGS